MSDAKIEFLDMNYEPTTDPAERARFGFACPKHKGRRCEGLIVVGEASGLNRATNAGIPMWNFDGNLEAPTFTPSVNCLNCWHGYVRAGRCVDCEGKDEPEPT